MKASLLSHRSTETSPFDSVIVCLYGSIHRLAGCRFDVKIIDEAFGLRHSTKTKAKVQAVPASLVAEFSFTFGTEEVDYRYSMHQALDADELHPVDCFGLPIAAPSGVARRKMVADWIQRQQHNWPGNTRAVLFYQAQAAAEFAEMLKGLGVEAGYHDACKPHGPEVGSKQVLCLARGQATDFGVKGVQTVILAEPTRQPSSLKYLQHLLQNVWRDKFHRRRWLIEVLDGNGRDSTVQNRMKAYSDHLSALTEPGHILSPLSRTSPQLLDLCGRSFPLLRSNLRSLLRAQGRADEPRWLQSLYAWLLEHQRKPRRHVDLEESLQAERLNRGYRYVRQKLFNKKEEELFDACTSLLGCRPWMQNLSDWVVEQGRLPQSRSTDAEERKHAKRWQNAQRYLQTGQLNAAETQLFESRVGNLSQGAQAPVREWMQSLHSWLRDHGQTLKASDPEEKLQTSRLKKAKEYAKAGKLNAAEQQLFHEILAARRGFHGSRPWIQNLTAWVRRMGSKPRRGAENPLERMQATRWSRAQGLLKLGHLTAAEAQLFLETQRSISEASQRGWLKSLHDRVRDAGRRPRDSVESERRQATRWIQAAAYVRTGKFNEEEKDLFLRCQEIAKAHKANMDTKVRDWLQSLHAWVTSHNKPRWNASDPEEKQQAQRLKTAQQRLKAGKLNLAEERLFQSCVTFLQSSA